MKGPFLTAAALALLGLVMLGREVRRFLRDDMRYASNPTEARRSSIAAVALALVLLALAGGVIGLAAGASRYRPLDAPDPPALTVNVTGEHGSLRIVTREDRPGSGSSTLAVVEPGWFSIVADEVQWNAPFRWVGFPSCMRPRAVLWARERADLSRADRIRRIEFSSDTLFESFLRGPASTLGLWNLTDIRTPWRPLRPGTSECLFSEKGTLVMPAGG